MGDLQPLSILRSFLQPYLRGYAWGTLCLLGSVGFQLATPAALRLAVDALGMSDAIPRITRYALLFLGLACAQGGFRFLSRRAFLGNARRVEHDLRGTYFSHLIRLPLHQVEQGRKGDFTSRATHDLLDVRLFLGAGLLNSVQTAALLACATVLLWRLHPGLTVAALAPFPLITGLVRWHSPRLHRRYREANQRAGDLSAAVQEAISGLRTTRAYGRENWQQERFEEHNRALRDAQTRVVRTWAALFPWVGVLASTGHAAVLGYGGLLVARGELTLGTFVAFNAYLAMLTWPMMALGWTLTLLQRGAAAMGRLQEILRTPLEPDGEEPLCEHGPGTALAAQDLGFHHAGAGDAALQSVTFGLTPGSTWGLVGPTAAGKTTLVEVLARLRTPSSGRVALADTPLPDLRNRELRSRLAVVPQEGFLFATSLADNVCVGRPRDPTRLDRALSDAGLDSEVGAMPDGVDTRVGEGGITLSGGQRQRLALARALYGEPSVLLLDAALSNLDARTAHHVLRGLRRTLAGTTLLVVSHRGVDIAQSDGVLYLENGRLRATGSHHELLSDLPRYRDLFREEELRAELEQVHR